MTSQPGLMIGRDLLWCEAMLPWQEIKVGGTRSPQVEMALADRRAWMVLIGQSQGSARWVC